MEEITLLKDFAVIMVVAGAVTLIFRRLRQPVILGYLIAGLLIGPYTPPFSFVSNTQTINMLADLGIILLVFAIGIDFSWNKIRQVGMSVLLIACIEIITMISLGYAVGRLLGWSHIEAFFLGAALQSTSTPIVVKILKDMGKLNALSTKLIVGISVVEDFIAIAILSLLSQITSTGISNFGDVGVIVLRLVIFVVATLVIGMIIVPRILKFVHRFQSKEALLITSLGLCFALALLGYYLGLSVAAGAFLIGALIGDTEYSKEITGVISPVRDMFAALFFVTIGMLINIAQIVDFWVPVLIVFVVFVLGKIFSNTVATFISGHDGKTSLNVGMGMPQAGELSLVTAKTGVDRGVVLAPLYPVIALVTAFTSLTTPYIIRYSESVTDFFDRKSPLLLKAYVSRMGEWLESLRKSFSSDSVASHIARHAFKSVIINLLIIAVLIGIGTFTLGFVTQLAEFSGIRVDIVGLLFSLLLLVLCLPSYLAIWRNVRNISRMASGLLIGRKVSPMSSRVNALRIILGDSIVIVLMLLIGMWFIPYVLGLFSIGSFALIVPLLLAVFIIYFILRFAFDIHGQFERSFSRVLLGREQASPSTKSSLPDKIKNKIAALYHSMKRPFLKETSKQQPIDKKDLNDH